MRSVLRIAVLAIVTFWSAASMADSPKAAADSDRLKKVLRIADREDVAAATMFLESQGSPLEIAEQYSTLMKKLYMPGKDVPRMILFGRAGIHFALSSAAKSKPEAAAKLKGLAKTIAYNLGANTWPGWKDKGITITATDRAVGLDAARTNLRLGIELKRDDSILGNAYWLLGAQLLANGKHSEAAAAFKKSATRYRAAKKPDFRQMADGYLALTKLAENPSDRQRPADLEAAIAKLTQLGTDDAKFFAQQIRTAKTVFVKPRAANANDSTGKRTERLMKQFQNHQPARASVRLHR